MRKIGMYLNRSACLFYALITFISCSIENDIPYPIVESNIESFEVEGQRGKETVTFESADINKNDRTVSLFVNDSVDVSKLKITKFKVSGGAEILLDSTLCEDSSNFPSEGFASLDSVSGAANTRVDFTKPVKFTLRTYQDYVWKVSVKQIIQRQVNVSNQIGKAVIDANTHNVVVYVAPEQELTNLSVSEMSLGGDFGSVRPDPLEVCDFSEPRVFTVSYGWTDVEEKWTVHVYHSQGGGNTAEIFPMSTKAVLTGTIQSGKTPEIEYRKESDKIWKKLAAADVSVNATTYTANLTKLTPGTKYIYRVNIDEEKGEESSFSMVRAIPLENGNMEDWWQDGKQLNPFLAGSTPFWGTGNGGSAAFIGNITTFTEQSVKGKAALLESKDAMVKLAAGNLFTGDFSLDGMNGILRVGRPFDSFPTALRLYYKYTTSTINQIGESVGELANLKGRPDSCYIYIALSDKPEPYELRTRPSTRQLFDKNDKNIIAYGEFVKGETVSSYQQITIPLEYRTMNRTPKMIVIVATSSKYGDYFIGGVGSKLWLDEMELVYE